MPVGVVEAQGCERRRPVFEDAEEASSPDRWVGDSITMTVTPIGRSTWRGTEVNEGAADVEVRNRGRRWIARGAPNLRIRTPAD